MENNHVDENEKVEATKNEVSEATSVKDTEKTTSDTPLLSKEVQETTTDEKGVDSFATPKEENIVQPAITQVPNSNPADNTSTDINNNTAPQNKAKETYSLDDKKIKKIVIDDIDETNEKLDKLEQETSINQEKKYVTNNHVYTVIKQISDLDTVQFYQVKREDNEIFLLKLFKTKQDIKIRTAYLYALERVPSDINLVHVYDTGTEGEYPFDIIDNHEGQSLINTKLSTEEIKIVLTSISKALNFVHKSGYAHLNINLENVFYDKEKKTAYLGDFVTKNHSNGLPVNKKLGYYAPELYQNITSISADYYALGVVLAGLVSGGYPFVGMSPQQVFKAIYDKTFVSSVSDSELKVLICGLTAQNYKRRFGLSDINDFLEGKKLKNIEVEETRAIKELKSTITYNKHEFDSKASFGEYLYKNWKETREAVASGEFYLNIKKIDSGFIAKYKEIVEGSKSPDEILSKILIYFDLGNFLMYKNIVCKSIEEFARDLAIYYPKLNNDYLNVIRSGILETALSFAYNKTNNESLVDDLRFVKENSSNPTVIYNFLMFKYAKEPIKIDFEGYSISSIEDVIAICKGCDDVVSLYKRMMLSPTLYAYFILNLDEECIVLSNENKATNSIDGYYYFLNAFSKKGINIKELIEHEFSAWLVNNYKKYTYQGKEAQAVKKELVEFFKDTVDKSDIFEYIRRRRSVEDKFINLFQNDVYFDHSKKGITTNKYDYYPIITRSTEKVCNAYLKELNVNSISEDEFFDISRQDATKVLVNAKSELKQSYELYYNHYVSVSQTSDFYKAQKIKKTYSISTIIVIILLAIYQVLNYIPFIHDAINNKYPHIFDNYIFITVVLALVPCLFFIILMPLIKKISRITNYRKAVNELVSTKKYIENNEALLLMDSFKTQKFYRKHKSSSLRISYCRVYNATAEKIANCAKYRNQRQINNHLIKLSERLFTFIHGYAISSLLVIIIFPIVLDIAKEEKDIKDMMYFLIPALGSLIGVLLSFVRFKKTNVGRFIFYITPILSIIASAACLWFLF